MSRRLLPLLLTLLLPLISLAAPVRAYRKAVRALGSTFRVTAVSADEAAAWRAIEAAIAEAHRVDRLFSYWQPTSEITAINAAAGQRPVAVSPEVLGLIRRALRVGELTDGAFDITFEGAERIYTFDKQEHPALPDTATRRRARRLVDFRAVRIDTAARTVFLPRAGMKLNLAGVLQGYAVRRCAALMREMGVSSGVLDASGDVLTWGHQADGSAWRVGIGDPRRAGKATAWLTVGATAVTTAGNYEQYFTVKGVRYGHILNPATGLPATGLQSVTVFCADVEIADALDTALFALGPEAGVALANRLQGIQALFITDTGKLLTTNGLHLNYYTGPEPANQGPLTDRTDAP